MKYLEGADAAYCFLAIDFRPPAVINIRSILKHAVRLIYTGGICSSGSMPVG